MHRIFFLLYLIFSDSLLHSQSFVAVRDEPRHHNVFENDFIRLLDVHLAPKDTTLYHLHNTPSVFIVLSNSDVGSRLLGDKAQRGANLTGTITYDPISTPRTHQVWNEDTNWFHVMDIELTSTTKGRAENLIQDQSLEKLFTEQKANGYKLILDEGKSIELPSAANGYLLVSLGRGKVELGFGEKLYHRKISAGHYQWVDAGIKFAVRNDGKNTAEFVLLQLK